MLEIWILTLCFVSEIDNKMKCEDEIKYSYTACTKIQMEYAVKYPDYITFCKRDDTAKTKV